MSLGSTTRPTSMDEDDPFAWSTPPITLSARSECLLGFPCFVAVTLYNPTEVRTWYRLPWGDPLKAPGPVAFTLTASDGRIIQLPGAPVLAGEAPLRGVTLEPGASRTLLLDLSDYEPEVTPGPWRLDAAYESRSGSSSAAPVAVTFVAPSPEDARGAGALKSAAADRFPTWLALALSGPDTLPDIELSPAAWRELAFHELLHRILHARQPPAAVDSSICDGFEGDFLEPEVALLRLELLLARNDSSAVALAEALLAAHPGLRWRVERIREGRGWIARGRRVSESQPSER